MRVCVTAYGAVVVRELGANLVHDQVRGLVHVSAAAAGDGSTWARLANLFWWRRNGRGSAPLLWLDICAEKKRLIDSGVSAVLVWRVCRCLKKRGSVRGCNCPMCSPSLSENRRTA